MSYFTSATVAFCLSLLLAACGGGGGSPGSTLSGSSVTPTGSGTTNGTSTATAKVAVDVQDASSSAVTSISISGAYTLRATVTNAAGTVQVGKLVNFTASSSLVTLSPTTALTDASGVASVSVAPASVSTVGATTVTASATVDGAVVTGQRDIAISASSLSLSALTPGSSSLASGGNTTLSVTALIGGSPAAGVPVNVSFSTSCGRINGSANAFTVTTSGSGVATADYTAVQADGSLCSGPVVLTASSAGAASRTATVTVAAPVANAITFVSATPAQIYVAGAGSVEQSSVKFKVLSSGVALSSVPVAFSLPNGASLGASLGSTSGTTNALGEVSVTVNSGSVPGPLKVRAQLASDASVFTDSQNLTIASGPPSQHFMSLAVGTYNLEGANWDGTTTKLTVSLADRQGNAVADGTVVNFTAEGGQVGYSCATTRVNNISSCSVDFQTQEPRPANGRVSVLAYVAGEKDYLDANSSNRFDTGDTLVPLGDPYRDDNENGSYDPGEFRIFLGGTGSCATSDRFIPFAANSCDTGLSTLARRQTVLLFSASSPAPIIPGEVTGTAAGGSVTFLLGSASDAAHDLSKLPMPNGTALAVDSVSDTTANGVTCTATLNRTTVPNTSAAVNPADPTEDLRTPVVIFATGCATGDIVRIKVTTPKGQATVLAVTLP